MFTLPPRPLLGRLALASCTLALMLGAATQASAQDAFPERPLRLVVGFAPGGGADVVARLIGARASRALGQQVVVENRPGATGTIAADNVARSKPDGYSLFLGSQSTMLVAPSLYPQLPFSPSKDFTPVTMMVSMPLVLVVNPRLVRAKTVAELDAQIRESGDGGTTYASSGQGGPQHIAGELYSHRLKTPVTHVPYKGEAPAITDVLGGQVPFMFANLPVAMPYVKSGQLRALAVTSLKRDPKAGDLPTMAESGYGGFEVLTWYGIFAPAGTPRPVVDKLYGAVQTSLQDNATRDKLAEQGFTVVGSDPDKFSSFIEQEVPRWATTIRDLGIRPE
ncbi:putattive exported protein [Bordetella ansorpii]|uniref:Putattive exported protein n=1 Tax=Bordetella ansorpii TaxID=288768 RepID=A0A157S857_9BORD|nr:tripartite tricarboxylate transporter substrate binding protein [Bordetella ansorpii]SAI66602.1 putattive exported protein [Bordetella ansorpii]